MKRAVYPGSFDPVTYGHLDIIRRSAALVDELIVGVLQNNHKKPLFSLEERVKILLEATKDMSNVRVEAFTGLSIDFVKKSDAQFLVRGLRAITDFDYELQMAQTNHKLEENVETIFLSTRLEYSYLSSTIVKEVASFNGDISQFVPKVVEQRIREKIQKRRV